MGTKFIFMMRAVGALSVSMSCLADLSSPSTADPIKLGLRFDQRAEFAPDRLSSVGGTAAAESNHQVVDLMDIGTVEDARKLSVQSIDDKSDNTGSEQLVDAFAVNIPFRNKGPLDAENFETDTGGFLKKKFIFLSEPSSIGIVVALGIGVVWIRRKLML